MIRSATSLRDPGQSRAPDIHPGGSERGGPGHTLRRGPSARRLPPAYHPAAVRLYWQQLIQADRVFNQFRSGFRGKASPVHLFWFWPGGSGEGAFYAYTYPEPAGYADYLSEADGALHSQSDKLYLLPYEYVRSAPDPDSKLLRFLDATYDAAALTGHWDRAALEVDPHRGPR